MLSPKKINKSGVCLTTTSKIVSGWSSFPQEPKAIFEIFFCEKAGEKRPDAKYMLVKATRKKRVAIFLVR